MQHFRVVLIYILHFAVSQSEEERESCDEVNNRCMKRVSCGMAWNNFHIGCNNLIFGGTTECSAHCTRALLSLFTDEQGGVSFTDCDCGSAAFCHMKSKEMEVCSTPVLYAIRALSDPTIVIDCNMAVLLCEADASCQKAHMYYLHHCQSLMKGEKCTTRCNNSIAILYHQAKAAKLINCSCKEDDPECKVLRYNTDRLCFHKTVHKTEPHNTTAPYKIDSSSVGDTLHSYCYILLVLNFIFLEITLGAAHIQCPTLTR